MHNDHDEQVCGTRQCSYCERAYDTGHSDAWDKKRYCSRDCQSNQICRRPGRRKHKEQTISLSGEILNRTQGHQRNVGSPGER